jgi:hypothetical protein
MTRPRGNATSKAHRAARQAAVVEKIKDKVPQTAIAAALGVSRTTIFRDLGALLVKFEAQNGPAYEQFKRAQLQIFELMERALLEGKIDTDVAREWRSIRSEISKLLGINSESRSVLQVSAAIDPEKLVGYRQFVYETRNVPAESFARIWQLCRDLSVRPDPNRTLDHLLESGFKEETECGS